MRDNKIVINVPARGKREEYIVKTGETHYVGMIVCIDPTESMVMGRFVWKIYNRAADGDNPAGPLAVVTEDYLRQQVVSGASPLPSYTAGQRGFLYIPLPGDEINLCFANLSGTGDDHPAGEAAMVDDGTGKLIVETGSPKQVVAVTLEAVTDPTTDTLIWCMWGNT